MSLASEGPKWSKRIESGSAQIQCRPGVSATKLEDAEKKTKKDRSSSPTDEALAPSECLMTQVRFGGTLATRRNYLDRVWVPLFLSYSLVFLRLSTVSVGLLTGSRVHFPAAWSCVPKLLS